MTVASRARTVMTMRADIERNQTGTTNAYGGADAPSFTTLATVPCRIWTNTRREVVDGEKQVQVEEIRAMFPLDADVTEADRINQVTDRRSAVLWAGPLSILTLIRRPTHLEASLRRDES